mmetsp:Transcript_27326/g.49285  ORF Transcript_27326/g.49285 Transcript_27326/m.49285 type:complete len:87 (-) Transcript_27326:123-383(-)
MGDLKLHEHLDHFSSSSNDARTKYIAKMKKTFEGGGENFGAKSPNSTDCYPGDMLSKVHDKKNLLFWIRSQLMQHTDMVKAMRMVA